MNAQPALLTGVRVVDFSRVIAGPYSTRILADFGAEVIKIEEPGRGDSTRSEVAWGRNVRFMGYNYGKKSVSLNLKDPAGLEIARRLAAKSDVLIENFRPGVMDRLGLGFASLQEANPRLIYCSITGFGPDGPNAGRPLHAGNAHALSGIMRIDTEEPHRLPAALGDPIMSMHVVSAVCAALYYRERTGRGQRIDLALLETIFAMMGPLAEAHSVGGGAQRPRQTGDQSRDTVPAGIFRGRDGFVSTGGGYEDQMWVRLAGVIGRQDLADKPHSWRRENADMIYHLIGEWVMSIETVAEAEQILARAGVVAGTVRTVQQVLADADLRRRGAIVSRDDGIVGPHDASGSVFHFSETPPAIAGPPPGLGEHTREVLAGMLDYDDATIESLYERGAIFSEPRPDRADSVSQ